jgi:hypothetical protein
MHYVLISYLYIVLEVCITKERCEIRIIGMIILKWMVSETTELSWYSSVTIRWGLYGHVKGNLVSWN